MTTDKIIQALEQGTVANRSDRFRRGNLIQLTAPGEVIMTGDLHGNEKNFQKLAHYAQLKDHPQRHLIIHELIHCPSTNDHCHSYLLVAQAAALKARFPHQVHYLLGNHAMAQISQDEVLKNGQPMVRSLNAGISRTYGEQSTEVTNALDQFLLSLPIAVHTENRIWMSHSLPCSRNLDNFDHSIFENPITLEDIRESSSLRALNWDRHHTEKCLEKLRQMWETDIFIVGHQPQAQGCAWPHDRMIILASDHTHGCFLPFELQHSYEPTELFGRIKPMASLKMPKMSSRTIETENYYEPL